MNEQMRNALAQFLQQQALTSQAGGDFPMPGGGPPNLPQITSARGGTGQAPRIGMEQGLPVAGGDLTLRGNISRPDPQGPVDWGAMLGYQKPF